VASTWDWNSVAELSTGAGTLVLAIATFAAVRSSNRSARVAERALLATLRPVLAPSRLDDPEQKVGFQDDRWFHLPGGRGIAEITPEAIYLLMSIRNVGSGMAVLDGWELHLGDRVQLTRSPAHDTATFRRLTRDLYVPPGEMGFWQGAFRDPSDPQFDAVATAIRRHEPFTIEVLYGDHEGGQRTITLFSMMPREPDGSGQSNYLLVTSRHWNLDRSDPR
jgi:hypothetical protein